MDPLFDGPGGHRLAACRVGSRTDRHAGGQWMLTTIRPQAPLREILCRLIPNEIFSL